MKTWKIEFCVHLIQSTKELEMSNNSIDMFRSLRQLSPGNENIISWIWVKQLYRLRLTFMQNKICHRIKELLMLALYWTNEHYVTSYCTFWWIHFPKNTRSMNSVDIMRIISWHKSSFSYEVIRKTIFQLSVTQRNQSNH